MISRAIRCHACSLADRRLAISAQLGAGCAGCSSACLRSVISSSMPTPKLPTAVSVANGRSSQMSPQHPPVFPDKAFFDLVMVALTLKHLSGEG